jgi:hypothetical protein
VTLVEKLDGFTADGKGNVIGTEADVSDGDVVRIDGRIEQRYRAPAPVESEPAPAHEYPSDLEIIMARLDVLDEKINALSNPA